MDKKTEKSVNTVKEEPKIESSENSELSNEEYKPTGSVESEDLNARNVKQTHVDILSETNEIVVVVDICTIVGVVHDQSANEKHISNNAEIQTILIAIQSHELETKADELYYKIFPLLADSKKTCRWLYSSSFPWLSILLHYKTR